MRLTLSDGSQIELSPAMVRAMRNTLTATGDRAWSCLDIDVAPETAQALELCGLVALSPEGPWFVTAAGLEVMDALELEEEREASEASPEREQATASSHESRRQPDTRPRKGVPPKRVTVHPEVSAEQARRLQRAIRAAKSGSGGLPEIPGPFLGGIGAQISLYFGTAFVAAIIMSFDVLFGLVAAALFYVIVVRAHIERRREITQAKARARNTPARIVEQYKSRYASGEKLDELARGMLGRAQVAVDTVLESSLHREGLLLDEIRNRVVLVDTEWWIARDLYEQAQTRQRIDSAPAVGERSRQAAERARAALAKEVARVESRIRTLESYADRVRAAELEVHDRELAAELDAIADQAEQAGAVRPQNDESLSALIQAQELALEIAAFSDDRDPEGTVRQGGGP